VKPSWREWVVPGAFALFYVAVLFAGAQSRGVAFAAWGVLILGAVAASVSAERAWADFLREHERVHGSGAQPAPSRRDAFREPSVGVVAGVVTVAAGFVAAAVSAVSPPMDFTPPVEVVGAAGDIVRLGGSAPRYDAAGIMTGVMLMLIGAAFITWGLRRRDSEWFETRRAMRYARQVWGARRAAWIAEAVALEPQANAEWASVADNSDDPFLDDPVT
jgi:hypothetical protein